MNSNEVSLPNGQTYRPNFQVTCQTKGIVYFMRCECQRFYIEKTKRLFHHRIRDHVSLMLKKKMETSISRHIGLYHNFDPLKMKFFALEHVPSHYIGGDIDRVLLQKESKWFYTLLATNYPGLNESMSFKPFL